MSEEREPYALVLTEPAAMMPVIDIRTALARRQQMTEFVRQIMVDGNDFGVIPGTGTKPTLLKPGAEKLTTFFGLSKRFAILEKVEDWDKPFFYYLYRCALYRGDLLIAEADGSCNSHESKYRYRQGERLCPKCNQPAIRRSKPPKTGWYCWSKIGGCGEQFKSGDPGIENQVVGRVENKDVADQTNTLQKMAQKRALVAATLLAVNASEFFTQDLEDVGDDEPNAPATASGKAASPGQTQPSDAQPPAPGPRPYPPAMLKAGIDQRIAHSKSNGELCTDAQRGLMVAKLNECFAGDPEADLKRHSMLKFLTGNDSAKLTTKAQASAILDWLIESQPDDTGDRPLKPHVASEAMLIVRHMQEAAGQASLPGLDGAL